MASARRLKVDLKLAPHDTHSHISATSPPLIALLASFQAETETVLIRGAESNPAASNDTGPFRSCVIKLDQLENNFNLCLLRCRCYSSPFENLWLHWWEALGSSCRTQPPCVFQREQHNKGETWEENNAADMQLSLSVQMLNSETSFRHFQVNRMAGDCFAEDL